MADTIRTMDGSDNLVIYLTEEKAVKRMGPNWGVGSSNDNLEVLYGKYGQENVKVVDKKVEFPTRRY